MDKTLKMLMAGGAFALMAGYANAAMVATTASDISVRSGPVRTIPNSASPPVAATRFWTAAWKAAAGAVSKSTACAVGHMPII